MSAVKHCNLFWFKCNRYKCTNLFAQLHYWIHH